MYADQAMGKAQAYATEASPSSPSPVRRMGETLGHVHELVERVHALADRLCGQMPEQADRGEQVKPLPAVGGILGAMQTVSIETDARIVGAHQALSRIENLLEM